MQVVALAMSRWVGLKQACNRNKGAFQRKLEDKIMASFTGNAGVDWGDKCLRQMSKLWPWEPFRRLFVIFFVAKLHQRLMAPPNPKRLFVDTDLAV